MKSTCRIGNPVKCFHLICHLSIKWPTSPGTSAMKYLCTECHVKAQCIMIGFLI